jgi:hypothetical protein
LKQENELDGFDNGLDIMEENDGDGESPGKTS